MTNIDLKICELRKHNHLSQKNLADALGVSFQSVSKWENGLTMPDITLLPYIAEYFHVSVDQLLGLSPLPYEFYIENGSNNRSSCNKNSPSLYKNRKYF